MVWKQATDCCAGTAVIYGAPDIVKISQLFSDRLKKGSTGSSGGPLHQWCRNESDSAQQSSCIIRSNVQS